MEKLQFDSGMRSYRLNGQGVLRFNPGDPNVYARFMEATDRIAAVEQQLRESAAGLEGMDAGAAAVKLMEEADKKLKALLTEIFGSHNDFDQLLQGVNLLAVADNGQRVITNLFEALQPVMVEGARRCAGETAGRAVEKARARRG